MKLKLLLESVEYVIHCDMDGVLSDFEGHFKFLTGHDVQYFIDKYGDKAFWDKVEEYSVKFWGDMPWMKDGKILWKFLKSLPNRVLILSSPSESLASVEGKNEWVQRELGDDQERIFIKEKYRYADKKHILIDDSDDKLLRWIKAGGIGILHKDAKTTIKKLQKILGE